MSECFICVISQQTEWTERKTSKTWTCTTVHSSIGYMYGYRIDIHIKAHTCKALRCVLSVSRTFNGRRMRPVHIELCVALSDRIKEVEKRNTNTHTHTKKKKWKQRARGIETLRKTFRWASVRVVQRPISHECCVVLLKVDLFVWSTVFG